MLDKNTDAWQRARNEFRRAATEYSRSRYSSEEARRAADEGIENILMTLGVAGALETKP